MEREKRLAVRNSVIEKKYQWQPICQEPNSCDRVCKFCLHLGKLLAVPPRPKSK